MLAGIFDLFAQTVDEVFDQFLLGQPALVGDLAFVMGQLRIDKLFSFSRVAGGFIHFVVAEIVAQGVGLFGFAQAIARALFGGLVVVFVTSGVLQDHFQRLAFPAAFVFLWTSDFVSSSAFS